MRMMSLRQLREEAGITQAQLQRRMGAHNGRLSQLEQGRLARPQLSTLLGYLHGLEVEVYLCAVLPDGRVMVLRDET